MGCDATTFGNHDFDLGPDGAAQAIAAAAKARLVPAVLASNNGFLGSDPTIGQAAGGGRGTDSVRRQRLKTFGVGFSFPRNLFYQFSA